MSTTAPDPSPHDRAVARGESMYEDPDTGFWVMTAATLLERGYCCGNGCRHCPYPPDVQARAGRPEEGDARHTSADEPGAPQDT